MINKFTGSSGVNILLKDIDGFKIVRKQTTKKEQIKRLKNQFEKQLFLFKLQNALFNIPPIIDQESKRTSFFYDYRYIEGITMSEALFVLPTDKLIKVLDKLVLIVEYFSKSKIFFETDYGNKDFRDFLKNKILKNCLLLNLRKDIKTNFLTKLELMNIPTKKTLYHGDLSFDNIILDKKNNIWLIDCIGTFYPHYWTDLSKLFQDIEGEWYFLKHGIKIDRFKNKELTCYLKEKILKLDKNYLNNHNFFMALIFLRILPYLKGKSKREKILKKIIYYLDNKIEN